MLYGAVLLLLACTASNFLITRLWSLRQPNNGLQCIVLSVAVLALNVCAAARTLVTSLGASSSLLLAVQWAVAAPLLAWLLHQVTASVSNSSSDEDGTDPNSAHQQQLGGSGGGDVSGSSSQSRSRSSRSSLGSAFGGSRAPSRRSSLLGATSVSSVGTATLATAAAALRPATHAATSATSSLLGDGGVVEAEVTAGCGGVAVVVGHWLADPSVRLLLCEEAVAAGLALIAASGYKGTGVGVFVASSLVLLLYHASIVWEAVLPECDKNPWFSKPVSTDEAVAAFIPKLVAANAVGSGVASSLMAFPPPNVSSSSQLPQPSTAKEVAMRQAALLAHIWCVCVVVHGATAGIAALGPWDHNLRVAGLLHLLWSFVSNLSLNVLPFCVLAHQSCQPASQQLFLQQQQLPSQQQPQHTLPQLTEQQPVHSPQLRSAGSKAPVVGSSGARRISLGDAIHKGVQQVLPSGTEDAKEQQLEVSLLLPARPLELGDLYRITEGTVSEMDMNELDEEWSSLPVKELVARARCSFTSTWGPAGPPKAEIGVQTELGGDGISSGGGTADAEALSAAQADAVGWRLVVEALREHCGDIAHDMKNPLNGVLALSQNVLQGTFGEVPQVAADQLGVVRSCAYHLLNMINMLRDMLKMTNAGELDMSPGKVQLVNPIEEVLQRMTPMVGSRLTISHIPDPSLMVWADETRLYQMIHVVLANAFKYTRKGTVTVEAKLDPEAPKDYVVLRVVDTGTGFSPTIQAKFNGPLSSTGADQLGLGLTMVKRVIRLFGGSLSLGNLEPSGGWVELRFKTDGAVPDLPTADGPITPVKPTVLEPRAALAPVRTPSSPPSISRTTSGASSPQGAPLTALAAVAQYKTPRIPGPGDVLPLPPGRGSYVASSQGSVTSGQGRDVARAAAAAAATAVGMAVAASSSSSGSNSNSANAGSRPPTPSEPPLVASNLSNDSQLKVAHIRRPSSTGTNNETTKFGEEGVRILIVDDDPINLDILEQMLRAEGYECLTAASGSEALEVYLTCDPPAKLVLLDVTLPDMSGHEVCTKMRSLTPGVPPPIIMISGKASTNDVIKGLQAGSSDYITKPFQPGEVIARIETQLRMFMGEVQQLQETAERNMDLLSHVLPPHILSALNGGRRVMAEKYPEVVILHASIVGFSMMSAQADVADCILSLHRLFSAFDTLTDKFGVHKIDTLSDCYLAAVGHLREDMNMSAGLQAARMLDFAREMLGVVRTLQYPEGLGKMELRIGLHVGPVHAGVLGVKYPRYSFFGTTTRLANHLQRSALPQTIHLSEMVYNRLRTVSGVDSLTPFTNSSFAGMGIIRTYLAGTEPIDPNALMSPGMLEYLRGAASTSGLQVMALAAGNNSQQNAVQVPHQYSHANMSMDLSERLGWGASNPDSGGSYTSLTKQHMGGLHKLPPSYSPSGLSTASPMGLQQPGGQPGTSRMMNHLYPAPTVPSQNNSAAEVPLFDLSAPAAIAAAGKAQAGVADSSPSTSTGTSAAHDSQVSAASMSGSNPMARYSSWTDVDRHLLEELGMPPSENSNNSMGTFVAAAAAAGASGGGMVPPNHLQRPIMGGGGPPPLPPFGGGGGGRGAGMSHEQWQQRQMQQQAAIASAVAAASVRMLADTGAVKPVTTSVPVLAVGDGSSMAGADASPLVAPVTGGAFPAADARAAALFTPDQQQQQLHQMPAGVLTPQMPALSDALVAALKRDLPVTGRGSALMMGSGATSAVAAVARTTLAAAEGTNGPAGAVATHGVPAQQPLPHHRLLPPGHAMQEQALNLETLASFDLNDIAPSFASNVQPVSAHASEASFAHPEAVSGTNICSQEMLPTTNNSSASSNAAHGSGPAHVRRDTSIASALGRAGSGSIAGSAGGGVGGGSFAASLNGSGSVNGGNRSLLSSVGNLSLMDRSGPQHMASIGGATAQLAMPTTEPQASTAAEGGKLTAANLPGPASRPPSASQQLPPLVVDEPVEVLKMLFDPGSSASQLTLPLPPAPGSNTNSPRAGPRSEVPSASNPGSPASIVTPDTSSWQILPVTAGHPHYAASINSVLNHSSREPKRQSSIRSTGSAGHVGEVVPMLQGFTHERPQSLGNVAVGLGEGSAHHDEHDSYGGALPASSPVRRMSMSLTPAGPGSQHGSPAPGSPQTRNNSQVHMPGMTSAHMSGNIQAGGTQSVNASGLFAGAGGSGNVSGSLALHAARQALHQHQQKVARQQRATYDDMRFTGDLDDSSTPAANRFPHPDHPSSLQQQQAMTSPLANESAATAGGAATANSPVARTPSSLAQLMQRQQQEAAMQQRSMDKYSDKYTGDFDVPTLQRNSSHGLSSARGPGQGASSSFTSGAATNTTSTWGMLARGSGGAGGAAGGGGGGGSGVPGGVGGVGGNRDALPSPMQSPKKQQAAAVSAQTLSPSSPQAQPRRELHHSSSRNSAGGSMKSSTYASPHPHPAHTSMSGYSSGAGSPRPYASSGRSVHRSGATGEHAGFISSGNNIQPLTVAELFSSGPNQHTVASSPGIHQSGFLHASDGGSSRGPPSAISNVRLTQHLLDSRTSSLARGGGGGDSSLPSSPHDRLARSHVDSFLLYRGGPMGAGAAGAGAVLTAGVGPVLGSQSTLEDLLAQVGLSHYAKQLKETGLPLAQVAAMDEAALKALGLATQRSREVVLAELKRLGL